MKKGKEKEAKKGKEKSQKDSDGTKLRNNIKTTRVAMDAYNRYSVNVRGTSSMTYGCLKEANIVTEFAALIKVTMPSPTAQDVPLQHMRPLECLGEGSAYMAWMTDYGEESDSSDETGDDSSGGNGDGRNNDEDDPMDEAMLEGGNQMDYD